jgi:hypothetical protein
VAAITLPSGENDHGAQSCATICSSGPLPSAGFHTRLATPSFVFMYATRFPSGDHTGRLLPPSCVSRTKLPRAIS